MPEPSGVTNLVCLREKLCSGFLRWELNLLCFMSTRLKLKLFEMYSVPKSIPLQKYDILYTC
jgi:hypothetical protein